MVIVIIVIAIALILAHGLWVSRSVTDESEFLIAGGKLGPFVAACTLVATYWSGYAFLGSVGVSYKFGYGQLLAGACWVPPVLIAILFFAKFLKKRALEIGSLTIPEYAGQVHDSRFVHFFSALLTLLLMIVFMVAQMKAMGYLMAPVLGTSMATAVIIMGSVITIYTLLGGMKAVAHTDMVQALGMTVGALVCIIMVFKLGSFSNLTETLNHINTELVNPTTGAPYGSSKYALLLIVPYGMVGIMSTPYIAVRFMSVKVDIKWYHMALAALPIMIIWELLPFVGFAARAYMAPLDKPDMAMPMFLSTYLNPVWVAIITVFILMAIMSTGDSILHNISSTISYDFRKTIYRKKVADSTTVMINRVVVAIAGLVAMILTLFSPPFFLVFLGNLGVGTLTAALVGPVFISIFWKGNRIGAITSMIGGGTVCAWGLLSGKLGWMEAPMLGDVVSFILYFGVSWLTFKYDPRAEKVRKTKYALESEPQEAGSTAASE